MSTWEDACDPVPACKDLPISPAEASRRRRRAKRVKGHGRILQFADPDDLVGDFLESDFEEMGA